MKLRIILLITLLALFEFTVTAQTSWLATDSLPAARINGEILRNPWAGGLNALQYSKMDLDRDGVEDLVVFDRTTSKVSTFLADPAGKTYTYAPEYEARFPRITDWMLLVDYNGDGVKELFAHTSYGVTVYRQQEHTTGQWTWVNFKPYLTTRGLSGNQINLEVVASDIPALVDFDGDGDMDIISFESEGDYVELNQNMSMERYGIPDSLEFVRNGQCWGNFRKHTCDDFVFGIECGVQTDPNPSTSRIKHAGNAILLHDFNGDGKKDLLIGNVECENLSLLFNEASGIAARFTSYQPAFPASDPVDLHIFPAAFLEDVDFDGVKDLLVSTNVYGNDDLLTDMSASSWYYRNHGTDLMPDYQLVQRDFLQSDMIDVGENAAVSLFDIDGDGDVDMIIGNRGRYNGQDFRGSLWLFRNTGTASSPVFTLETGDYLGLSSLGYTDLQPQWLDFNGDGTIDLGIAATANRRQSFFYFPNTGTGAVSLNIADRREIPLPSDLTVSDRLHFYDFDRDGDADLLVGGFLGNISLYENAGSAASPDFVLRDSALGGVGPTFSGRYRSLAVGDIDLDGKADIITVDQSGKAMILHDGDWGKWNKKDTAIVANRLTGGNYAPYFGNRLQVAVGDFNGDKKPDVAIGTMGGGIYLLRNILPVSITGREPEPRLVIYPNPSEGRFYVSSHLSGQVAVYDLNGIQVYASDIRGEEKHPVLTTGWRKGLYLVRLQTASGQQQVGKVIVN